MTSHTPEKGSPFFPFIIATSRSTSSIFTRNPPRAWLTQTTDHPFTNSKVLSLPKEATYFFGDFNVHHEHWGGFEVGRPHELALTLIDKMEALGLEMITPQGKKTYDYHGRKTTIDLIMADETLINRVLQCDIDETLKSGSDHKSVKITFILTTDGQEESEEECCARTTTRGEENVVHRQHLSTLRSAQLKRM